VLSRCGFDSLTLQLIFFGQVQQNTDEDWNDAQIELLMSRTTVAAEQPRGVTVKVAAASKYRPLPPLGSGWSSPFSFHTEPDPELCVSA